MAKTHEEIKAQKRALWAKWFAIPANREKKREYNRIYYKEAASDPVYREYRKSSRRKHKLGESLASAAAKDASDNRGEE